MSKGKWTDEDIEQTLTQLPPVKDRQSKDELFRAIEKRANDNVPSRFQAKKKRPWLVPAMASVAAIFIILLIIPPLFNGNDGQFLTSDDAADTNNNASINVAEVEENDNEPSNNAAEDEADMNMAENENADNDDGNMNENEEVQDENFNSDNDNDVPVERADNGMTSTAFVPHVVSHEGTEYVVLEEEDLDEVIPEEEALLYALHDYDPTSGQYLNEIEDIELNDETAVIHFSYYDALESLTSAEHNFVSGIFQEVFSLWGFKEIVFMAEGDPGIMYGQSGEVENMEVSLLNRGYYLVNDAEGTWFVSGMMAGEETEHADEGEPFTFEETVGKMEDVRSDQEWYRSAIPEGVSITGVQIPGDTAQVRFEETGNGGADDEELESFFKALNMTAKFFTLDSLEVINTGTGDVVTYEYH